MVNASVRVHPDNRRWKSIIALSSATNSVINSIGRPRVHNTGHSAGECEMTVSAGSQGRKRIASGLKLQRWSRTRQVKIWSVLLRGPALRIDTAPRAQRRLVEEMEQTRPNQLALRAERAMP